MLKVRKLVLPSMLVIISAGSTFAGQPPHIVAQNQLSTAVAAQVASEDGDRAAVREALARPEVKSVAKGIGIDVTRLNSAADTLAGADLEHAASAARQVNEQLVGGASSVVISTTTIIIILLVVILIVVIAK